MYCTRMYCTCLKYLLPSCHCLSFSLGNSMIVFFVSNVHLNGKFYICNGILWKYAKICLSHETIYRIKIIGDIKVTFIQYALLLISKSSDVILVISHTYYLAMCVHCPSNRNEVNSCVEKK